MRSSNQAQLLGVLGLLVLSPLLGQWLWDKAAGAPPPVRQGLKDVHLAPAHSPSDAALRRAKYAWLRAQGRVAREIETWPSVTAEGVIWHLTDARRQALMARDQGGDLSWALAAARQAAALARTPREAYGAAMILARLECDAGHHREELRYAREMVALQPGLEGSWAALHHANHCNGLRAPEMSAEASTDGVRQTAGGAR